MADNRLWNADLGDGTYKNPILYRDYSDPDAIRVGEDYYMISSSFSNAPGIPLLHSKDLVNWEVVNYVLKELPAKRYDEPMHGEGVWAPSIRYHEGTFFVCFPCMMEGIYMTTATDPLGEWSEPVLICDKYGWIDPCPFWDDDGQAYLVAAVAKGFTGYNSVLHMLRMTPDGKKTYGEVVTIFDGNDKGQYTLEGPKLYKKNGYYYIFAPAGGVKPGWQTVLRSKSIWGPYEYREVLKQGRTDIHGPHQGAWVDTVTGEDWFLHFQDLYAVGRVVHLQPMTWTEDGWPIIGTPVPGETYGEPVEVYQKPNVGREYPPCEPSASDEFAQPTLGLQWQWNANPKKEWYRLACEDTAGAHGIYLKAMPHPKEKNLAFVKNLLLQKWPMREFCCVTKLHLDELKEGDVAGILSLGTNFAALAATRSADGLSLHLYDGVRKDTRPQTDTVICSELPSTVYLKYYVKENGYETGGRVTKIPLETIHFAYSLDGISYTHVHEIRSVQGFWVGVKNGCFAIHNEEGEGGEAFVEYIKYNQN